MGGNLLEQKKITLPKLVQAITMALLVVGTAAFLLNGLATELEDHFHIFNSTLDPEHREMKIHPFQLVGLVFLFPVIAMSTLVLLIPLLVYVSDHAALQALNPLRPDDYARLLHKVYAAWIAGGDGKLKMKDL